MYQSCDNTQGDRKYVPQSISHLGNYIEAPWLPDKWVLDSTRLCNSEPTEAIKMITPSPYFSWELKEIFRLHHSIFTIWKHFLKMNVFSYVSEVIL